MGQAHHDMDPKKGGKRQLVRAKLRNVPKNHGPNRVKIRVEDQSLTVITGPQTKRKLGYARNTIKTIASCIFHCICILESLSQNVKFILECNEKYKMQ